MIVYEDETDIGVEITPNYYVVGDNLEYISFKREGTYTSKSVKMYDESISYFIKMIKRIP